MLGALKAYSWLPNIINSGKAAYDLYNSMPSSWKQSRRNPPKAYPFSQRSTRPRLFIRKRKTTKGSRKRTFKKRRLSYKSGRSYSLKRKVTRMSKKLSMIPTPAPTLYYDQIKLQYTVPQGAVLYTGLGGQSTQITASPPSFTSSATDPYLLLAGPINSAPSSTAVGYGKTLLKGWRQDYRMTNIDNAPVEVQCICIKAKKDVPFLRDLEQARELATASGTLGNWNKLYATFEYWLSNAMRHQYSLLAGTTNELASLNPNYATGGAGASQNTNFTNMPGFKLTDCAMFNEFFKIKSTKTRVIQPGESYNFHKFSKRPRLINEPTWFDQVDFIASTSTFSYACRFLAKKGWNYYVWRFNSIPVSAAAGGTNSVTLGDGFLNIVIVNVYKTTYVSSDKYTAVVPTTPLPVGITEKLIFPGTSTATAQAPAT